LERTYVYAVLGVVFLASSMIMAYLAGEKTIESKSFSKNIVDLDEPLPISSITGYEYSFSNITYLSIKNTGSKSVLINISCMNTLETIYLEPSNSIELHSLTGPCILIPWSCINATINLTIEREVMPYAWLSIPSLMFLVLSIGLLFTYSYVRVIEKKTLF